MMQIITGGKLTRSRNIKEERNPIIHINQALSIRSQPKEFDNLKDNINNNSTCKCTTENAAEANFLNNNRMLEYFKSWYYTASFKPL